MDKENFKMRLSDKEWVVFGRWMMIVSALACFGLAFYREEGIISWLLRMWTVAFGLYCIYIALFK
jgi:Na+/proline symporter